MSFFRNLFRNHPVALAGRALGIGGSGDKGYRRAESDTQWRAFGADPANYGLQGSKPGEHRWGPGSDREGFFNAAMGQMDEFGNPMFLPGGRIAPTVQHMANIRAMHRNDQLMQEGYAGLQDRYREGRGALMSGLGNLQTYRPGGAAAMLSPYYQGLNRSLMREGDQGLMTAAMRRAPAPDLMFRYDERARHKAQERARQQAIFNLIGQGLGLAAGVGTAIATGGASAPSLALSMGQQGGQAQGQGGQAQGQGQGQAAAAGGRYLGPGQGGAADVQAGGVPSAPGALPGTAQAPAGDGGAGAPPRAGVTQQQPAGGVAPGGGGRVQQQGGGGPGGGGGGPVPPSGSVTGYEPSAAEFQAAEMAAGMGGGVQPPSVQEHAAELGMPPSMVEGALRATSGDVQLQTESWDYLSDRLFNIMTTDVPPGSRWMHPSELAGATGGY